LIGTMASSRCSSQYQPYFGSVILIGSRRDISRRTRYVALRRAVVASGVRLFPSGLSSFFFRIDDLARAPTRCAPLAHHLLSDGFMQRKKASLWQCG
jgi:hypothetical protein